MGILIKNIPILEFYFNWHKYKAMIKLDWFKILKILLVILKKKL